MRNLVKRSTEKQQECQKSNKFRKKSGQSWAGSACLPAVPASFPASNGKVIASSFHCTFDSLPRADLFCVTLYFFAAPWIVVVSARLTTSSLNSRGYKLLFGGIFQWWRKSQKSNEIPEFRWVCHALVQQQQGRCAAAVTLTDTAHQASPLFT